MKRILIILCLSIIFAGASSSQTFTVNGIHYRAISGVTPPAAEVILGVPNYTGNVVIPSTVTYNTVVYDVKRIAYSAFSGCAGLTSVQIPNSITSIQAYAFVGCTGLTSFVFPPAVTVIEDLTFSGCTGLTSIEIPATITSIKYGAFKACTGLTTFAVHNQISEIQTAVFVGCTALTSINVANDNTSYTSVDGVLYDKTLKTLISCPAGKTTVTIPGSVTTIKGGAFDSCTGLTSINLPGSLTTIEGGAFYGCSGLTAIVLPESLTLLGNWALANCTSLTTVFLPASATTSGNPFTGCSALTSIDVHSDNVNLASLDGVLYTKAFTVLLAFPGAKTAVDIPNTVLTIANFSFAMCTNLSSVVIPEGVKRIGSNAFQGCTGLTKLDIAGSVTRIESLGFFDCISLASITSHATVPPTLDVTVFGNVPKAIPLKVPAESISEYSTANQWKDFTNISSITVGIDDDNQPSISVYPNPAINILSINGIGREAAVNIYRLTGELVLSVKEVPDNEPLDISNLHPGMYLIQAVHNGRTFTTRFIKVR